MNSIQTVAPSLLSSGFTLHESAETLVREHLTCIVRDLVTAGLPLRAILLSGSFGRGEGTVHVSGNESSVNDYDIVLVTSRNLSFLESHKIRRLRERLIADLSLKHLDLMSCPVNILSAPALTLYHYDLKFASKVLWGDERVRDLIPCSVNACIPLQEIENLLLNRMVTLLEGSPAHATGSHPVDRSRQVAKVIYAVIDALSIQRSTYKPLYFDKLSQLELLFRSARSDPRYVSLLEWMPLAWDYKAPPGALNSWWEFACQTWRQVTAAALLTLRGISSPDSQELQKRWRYSCTTFAPPETPWIRFATGILSSARFRRGVEIEIYRHLTEYSSASHAWQKELPRLIESWYHSSW